MLAHKRYIVFSNPDCPHHGRPKAKNFHPGVASALIITPSSLHIPGPLKKYETVHIGNHQILNWFPRSEHEAVSLRSVTTF